MKKVFITAQDRSGNVGVNAEITVVDAATGNAATIYSDNGQTTKNNPFLTDENGSGFFYAANGRYDVQQTGGGLESRTDADVVVFDPVDAQLQSTQINGLGDLSTQSANDILLSDGSVFTPSPLAGSPLDVRYAFRNAVTNAWIEAQANRVSPAAPLASDQTGTGHIAAFKQAGTLVAWITNPGGAEFSHDVVVQGNLHVNGTEFISNTETVEIEDNIMLLNSGQTGSPTIDFGLEGERGTATNARLVWDESADRWTAGIVGAMSGLLLDSHLYANGGTIPEVNVAGVWTANQTWNFNAGALGTSPHLGGQVTLRDGSSGNPVSIGFNRVGQTGAALVHDASNKLRVVDINGAITGSKFEAGAILENGTRVVNQNRTINSGVGLQGGGNLSANRTLSLDINGLTAEATVDGAADYVVMYDASIGAHRKVLAQDLADSGGTGLTTGDLYVNGGTIPEVDHAATIAASWTFSGAAPLIKGGDPNARIKINNTTAAEEWFMGVLDIGGLSFSLAGSGGSEMDLNSDGGLSMRGYGSKGLGTVNGELYDAGTRVATLGANTFTGGRQQISASFPKWIFYKNDDTADEGKWRLIALSGVFRLQSLSDDESVINNAIEFKRNGASISQIEVGTRLDANSGLSVGGGATISKIITSTASFASGSYNENTTVLNATVSGAAIGDTVVVNGELDNSGSALPIVGAVVSADTVNVRAAAAINTNGSNTVYIMVIKN